MTSVYVCMTLICYIYMYNGCTGVCELQQLYISITITSSEHMSQAETCEYYRDLSVVQEPSKGQDPPAGPRTLVTKSVKIFTLPML